MIRTFRIGGRSGAPPTLTGMKVAITQEVHAILMAIGDKRTAAEKQFNAQVPYYKVISWYARRDLNPQPLVPKTNALSS